MNYIHKKYSYGVIGDLQTALADPNAPTAHTGEPLTASDFENVSTDEYDNTLLDLRYEDGEWQQ